MDADKDLYGMTPDLLITEVQKLRNAIRYHRDQKGDDRCWRDDVKLYALLPEGQNVIPDLALPPAETFLPNCALNCLLFWKHRQLHAGSLQEVDNAIVEEYNKYKSLPLP